ncbi:aquaporin [Candidatus Saccharibacteria bacterium]|nr:aquaporin [Candidatus Saccharibacteria bacterium]
MATKKPKTSQKTTKSKATKSKAAAKTVKPVVAAPKTKTVEKKPTENKSCFKGFFAKKYEENESILTIFKKPKFYGALLGEVFGTMLLTMVIFAVMPFQGGAFNVTQYILPITAILIAVYAFSGACLNPLITVGMMATRRMSVIRGVMYIIAEVLGAWFGWLIFNAFHLAGGETAMDMSALSAIGENQFWLFAMVELLGAIIIGFFFTRALAYKRSAFTFAIVVAGGIAATMLIGYVASAAFLGLNNNFILNPAIAMMLQIFPTAGENFGEILGGICQALSVYALLPMIGGVIGFYLSDFTARLSGEN